MLEAALLGLVQGLTEFLPVSSSGHLAIFQAAFGWKDADANLAFSIAVHVGSLAAVVWFVRREIIAMLTTERRLLAVLVVATLPIAVVGLLIKDMVAELSADLTVVGGCLIATGIVLAVARRMGDGRWTMAGLPFPRAFVVGIAQACAILPGASRSGLTLAGCLGTGMERGHAVRFAFLLALPAIAGAGLLMLADGGLGGGADAGPMAVGALASFASSLFAMKVMVAVVARRRLGWFAAYCVAVGAAAILFG